MNKQNIKIDIVSDINCPWCYLGEARLAKAINQTQDKYNFEVQFKPYELNPFAPQEGENKKDYFIRNYGSESLSRLDESSRHLKEAGQTEDIIFDFEKSTTVHNTFNGHRLIWLAGKYDVQVPVAKALFRANFTNGENVNDPAVLTQIGLEHNIPAEVLNDFFAGEEGKAEVKALEQQAQQSGISGVPAFIINDRYLISGAQPTETFVNVLQQIAPVYGKIVADGATCEVGENC
ncbi:DsbA family oxidoreductase [Adhaeribacter rhizoryzae]|uniref:DsbA family oxidoreductase n=1 Tax=Adhaeribacter rhizoryzae TaxID=2607907 RepID=A0A5M6D7N6_9BACT|nr:DsbA family oxidoreductase [Adhaeribacter rhizoryzae]KAA5543541.1 DsbA family oxidoreductase [Adhaeribacter rhizoryzae]